MARRWSLVVSLVAWSLAAGAELAADWPQWRGPSLDGTAAARQVPLEWGPEENVAWRVPMPARSGSTPIVTGDRLLLNVALEERQGELELWCLDRRDGEVLWRRSLGGGNEFLYKQNLSSPSPVTDGERVWVITGTGVLAAFDLDGGELWRRDLQEEYGSFGLLWGYASSPLLLDGSLVVQVLHGMKTDDPSYVMRVDGGSGETVWRVERPTDAVRESPDAYTTPAVLRRDGATVIVVSGGDVVTGHDFATGRELWRADVLNPDDSTSQRIVASPLVAGGRVLAFGKRGPVVAIEPGGRGDVTATHVAWRREKGTDVPTPVSDGEHLYMVTDNGVAWCLELADGDVVWGPERLAPGTYSASPVLAAGRVYATSEEGVTTVFRAGREFEVLARNDLGGYTLSSPAVADGRIYLRTADHLWAIGPTPR